jgi:hypothetical protein
MYDASAVDAVFVPDAGRNHDGSLGCCGPAPAASLDRQHALTDVHQLIVVVYMRRNPRSASMMFDAGARSRLMADFPHQASEYEKPTWFHSATVFT